MQFCRILPITIGKTVWIVFSIIFPYFPLFLSLSFTFIQDFKEFDTAQGLASFCLQLLTTLYMMLAVQLGGVCKKTKNGKSWWRMVSASFCVYKSATFAFCSVQHQHYLFRFSLPQPIRLLFETCWVVWNG